MYFKNNSSDEDYIMFMADETINVKINGIHKFFYDYQDVIKRLVKGEHRV